MFLKRRNPKKLRKRARNRKKGGKMHNKKAVSKDKILLHGFTNMYFDLFLACGLYFFST
jgi:hypothetical protein